MARVTVEDCIDKVDNRFDLVLLAATAPNDIVGLSNSRLTGTTTRIRLYRCAKSPIQPFRPRICGKNWCIHCRNSSKSTNLSRIPCP